MQKFYSVLDQAHTGIRPLNSTQFFFLSQIVPPLAYLTTVSVHRTSAQDIQQIINSLNDATSHTWLQALRSLLENFFITFHALDPVESIEGYLDRSKGFLSANSFTGCHPPRTIRVCTKSIIETAKCDWLGESALVHGIEPEINCIKADNETHCMQALNDNVADVVLIDPDFARTAIRY